MSFIKKPILITTLLFSSIAMANKYSGPELRYYLEMPKVISSIVELQKLEDYPILPNAVVYEDPKFEYTEDRDKAADDILKRLNKIAFRYGDQTALRFCVDCKSAKFWTETMIVIFDADYFTKTAQELGCKNKEGLYAFVLAHELGHYLHELHISRHGKSPNNLGSCFAVPKVANTKEEKIENDKVAAWKHAEVDMYAMALTQALGYDLDCSEKFLAQYEATSGGVASYVDASVRWRSMQYLRSIQK